MGLFSTVIEKRCIDKDCSEFDLPKPANSQGFCDECAGPMKEITKTNIMPIVISLVVLVLVLGGGGYVGFKAWLFKKTVDQFQTAIGLGDLYEIEDIFTAIQAIDSAMEKCPECVEQFQGFLTEKFEQAFSADNIEEAKRLAGKLKEFGFADACPDCDQRITDAEASLPYREALSLQVVEAGDYTFSDYLKRYLGYLNTDSITIDAPFEIQAGEVTVAQFRQYADSLDDAARQALGSRWEKDSEGKTYADERPVENVSWQDATNYAAWLSGKTRQNLQLPTRQQWAAASVRYPDPQPILGRSSDKASEPLTVFREGQDIDHLLGNMREWSSESCGDSKYYLLGENYLTDPTDPEAVGQPNCAGAKSQWSGVGFRLVNLK